MATSVGSRFSKQIEEEIERLEEKEGKQINATSIIIDDDGCQYMYSLASLDFMWGLVEEFQKGVSNRQGENRNDLFFDIDMKRKRILPSQITFYLRGYIMVVSEDNLFLEEKKLEELRKLLEKWSDVHMTDGEEQNNLGLFLRECESRQIKDLYNIENKQMSLEDFINYRVKKKLTAVKDFLIVSTIIVSDIFDEFWGDYGDILIIQEKKEIDQQEYINKVINEKLELSNKSMLKEYLEFKEKLESIMQLQSSIKEGIDDLSFHVFNDTDDRIKKLEEKDAKYDLGDVLRKIQQLENWYNC